MKRCRLILFAFSLLLPMLVAVIAAAPSRSRPNVILIVTDDQGYGDLAFNGNPKIRTPNMDRLAREGVRFENFHVNPVCSPTRASLMTGRYYYRTGVVDTYLGRSMMHPDEVTIAGMLAGAGYRTSTTSAGFSDAVALSAARTRSKLIGSLVSTRFSVRSLVKWTPL
jgi:hypothetical protein